MTTPKTNVVTKITRHYVYDPATNPVKITPLYGRGEEIYVTDVIISRTNDQAPTAEVTGVAAKKDGTPGRAMRNAGSLWRQTGAPDWLADLMRQMPTPRVTLVPPTKGQTA